MNNLPESVDDALRKRLVTRRTWLDWLGKSTVLSLAGPWLASCAKGEDSTAKTSDVPEAELGANSGQNVDVALRDAGADGPLAPWLRDKDAKRPSDTGATYEPGMTAESSELDGQDDADSPDSPPTDGFWPSHPEVIPDAETSQIDWIRLDRVSDAKPGPEELISRDGRPVSDQPSADLLPEGTASETTPLPDLPQASPELPDPEFPDRVATDDPSDWTETSLPQDSVDLAHTDDGQDDEAGITDPDPISDLSEMTTPDAALPDAEDLSDISVSPPDEVEISDGDSGGQGDATSPAICQPSDMPFLPGEGSEPLYAEWPSLTVDPQNLSDILANWRLQIDGLVVNPIELTFAELVALPCQNQVTDLHCYEGWSAYAIPWIGVHLSRLLEIVQPFSAASHLTFHCRRGIYAESIPIEVAYEPRTLLAYGVNGSTLPENHGFPVRLVVPRYNGYKNAKCVERIELSDHPVVSYWVQFGYTDQPEVDANRLRDGYY